METFKEYFSEKNLLLAYERYKRSKKSVKDIFGFKAFTNNLEDNLKNLSDKLLNGNYKPSLSKKFYMPKSSLTQRTQTILCIEDALVFQAIGNKIGQITYDELSKNYSIYVFGSLLNEEVKYGEDIYNKIEDPQFFFYQYWPPLYSKFSELIYNAIIKDKVLYKFETDITGFFDCIPHFNLLSILDVNFNIPTEILDLLSLCLNRWSGTRDNLTPGVGIPQGPETSYLLANIMLHDLDNQFIDQGIKYFRYMDDIHIFGYEKKLLQKYLVNIDTFLKSNGLSINAKKTKIENVIHDESEPSLIRFLQVSSEDDDFIDSIIFTPKPIIPQFDSEQDAREDSNYQKPRFLTSEEIIKYYLEEIQQITCILPNFFEISDQNEIIVKYEIIDNPNSNIKREKEREILNIAYRYRTAFYELTFYLDITPNKDLIKYWLCLLKTYYWRANNFCWVLNLYKGEESLKGLLFELINEFEIYEWIRYNIISTLTITQKFNKEELQKIFRELLLKETSPYAREAYYKLLLYHCDKDDQFFKSIIHKINGEHNIPLRNELLFYSLIKKQDLFTIDEIMESFRI